jgi:hypothetical protein
MGCPEQVQGEQVLMPPGHATLVREACKWQEAAPGGLSSYRMEEVAKAVVVA